MNKKTKILLAVSGVLLAVVVIALISLILRSRGYDGIVGWLFPARETQVPTQPAPTETPGPTASSAVPTQAPTRPSATDPVPSTVAPTLPVQPEATVLRIGVNGFEQNFNPYHAVTAADRAVIELTQANLLTRDRAGLIVEHAIEGEYRTFNGNNYYYTGLADISTEYDAEADITTYHIRLREDVSFSDGIPMTIDDVIFNYYVVLQPQYDGPGAYRTYDIVGLLNYYYNKSTAESITVTEQDVDARLQNALDVPQNDVVADFILGLIRDVLTSEMALCQQTWDSYPGYELGNSANEFFYNIYGLEINYPLPTKTSEEVLEDVIRSYGLNYTLLADRYAVDPHYFDETIRNYVRELRKYEWIQVSDGDPVDHISGIVRTGTYSMDLKVYGYDPNTVYGLLDIYVAPLHYYGDTRLYNYDEHRFGFIRSNFRLNDGQWTIPVGAGPFVYGTPYDADHGICSLEANHLYYQGPPNVDKLELITVGKSIYSSQEEAYIYAIFQNKIDVADISSTRALYDTIRLMNANGELNGDRILSSRYDTAAYSFIGINAEKINIAGLPDSESSKSLRKALAVLFAAYRDEVRAQQYGDSATVIDYPISYTFYAAPHKNDPDYHAAYSLNQVGGEIFTPGMTAEDRAAAALDAAKGYLRRAGYVFDEATGQATSPEGAPQRFEILICDDPSDPASTLFYVLDRVKSVMHSLGLVLDIRTVKTEIDLLVALNLGETSMWCSAWTDTDPAYYLQYHSSSRSEGGYNFTNINDLGLDLLLDELSRRPDSEVKAQLYRACMDHILDWAVMIPCFQRQNATLFNAVTVKADSVSPDTTPYWSWLQQAASLEIRR